jgi:hypothetical protein
MDAYMHMYLYLYINVNIWISIDRVIKIQFDLITEYDTQFSYQIVLLKIMSFKWIHIPYKPG